MTQVLQTMVGPRKRRRGGASARDAVLSNDLFEAMLDLRDRDANAFAALLEFARRVAELVPR